MTDDDGELPIPELPAPEPVEWPDPPLFDGQVGLRAPAPADAPAYAAARVLPEVEAAYPPPMHGLPWTAALARAGFARNEKVRASGLGIAFAVVDAEDRFLGQVGIHAVEWFARTGDVGFWLAREARGRRVATGTLILLARWAFDSLRLVRLQARTGPANLAARRTLTGAGFVLEGRLRGAWPGVDGPEDDLVYGLLPGDPVPAAVDAPEGG